MCANIENIKNSSPVVGEVVEDRRGYVKRQCNNLPNKKEQRKELRKNATPAEVRLWSMLKGKQQGVRWRRQFSIGPYVIDFYSPSAKLAIELDGARHYTESGADIDYVRTKYLLSKGVRVLRFENVEIWRNLEVVLKEIAEAMSNPSVLSDSSPKTGEQFREK